MAEFEDRNLIIYTDEDYKGSLNLRVMEKAFILEAWLQMNGNRTMVANKLGISYRSLSRKTIQHGLEDLFSLNSNELIINELDSIKKKHPLIFMTEDEFSKCL